MSYGVIKLWVMAMAIIIDWLCLFSCGALDRQLLLSSIISYNNTDIAYNHHTNIYSQTCSIVAGGNVLQLASTGK